MPFEELAGVGGRHVEVDDALDAQGQTEDQANQHERHERGATFDEVLLHGLVEAQHFAGFSRRFSSSSWLFFHSGRCSGSSGVNDSGVCLSRHGFSSGVCSHLSGCIFLCHRNLRSCEHDEPCDCEEGEQILHDELKLNNE